MANTSERKNRRHHFVVVDYEMVANSGQVLEVVNSPVVWFSIGYPEPLEGWE